MDRNPKKFCLSSSAKNKIMVPEWPATAWRKIPALWDESASNPAFATSQLYDLGFMAQNLSSSPRELLLLLPLKWLSVLNGMTCDSTGHQCGTYQSSEMFQN